MKKVFISTILFLVFSAAVAQEQAWPKAYEQVYGTQQEYNGQTALRKMMGYDFYRLIGFKSFYTNGPSGFLQQARNFSMDASESKNRLVYKLTKKDRSGKSGRFYLTYWLDNDDRVTKARFSGDLQELAYLFLNYWPSNTDWTDAAQLKKGVLAEKEILGEKVIFNYKSSKPFIEIISFNSAGSLSSIPDVKHRDKI